MTPADADLERQVLGWIAEDPDARSLFFEELERRDFWELTHRGLFTVLRAAWRKGVLAHRYEIRGTHCVHAWDGLTELDRAELNEILESGDVRIYFVHAGRGAVTQLREFTKQRGILAAAERVLAGERIADPVLEYLLRDESASA